MCGVDRVVFGSDFGPVPYGIKEHVQIVEDVLPSPAERELVFWKTSNKYSAWAYPIPRPRGASSIAAAGRGLHRRTELRPRVPRQIRRRRFARSIWCLWFSRLWARKAGE
jgi:hypothetical protein